MIILNLGAGKIKPLLEDVGPDVKTACVNVDTSYYTYRDPGVIESSIVAWKDRDEKEDVEYFCTEDAFTFMERTTIIFDRVCAYRFLEHIPFDRVPYFIYLLSTITKKDSIVDIIVPNYHTLAKMLLAEGPLDELENFEAHNILLTTELLNEPGCPHASIWTANRAYYFMELEKRFRVGYMNAEFEFDGRNIYLRFWGERL